MALYDKVLTVSELADIGAEVTSMRWWKDVDGVGFSYRLHFNPDRKERKWDLIQWSPMGGEISLGTFVHLHSAIEAANREVGRV